MTNKQKAYNDVVNYIFSDAINGKEFSEDKINRMLCYSIARYNNDKRIINLRYDKTNKEEIKNSIVKEYTNESTIRMASSIKRSFDSTNEKFGNEEDQ